MSRFKAFMRGMYEFRSDFTTHYGPALIETYDSGRDWAHAITLRWFDCWEAYSFSLWNHRDLFVRIIYTALAVWVVVKAVVWAQA